MKKIASLSLVGMLSLSMLCSTAFAVNEAESIYDIGSEQSSQTDVYGHGEITQSNVDTPEDRYNLGNTGEQDVQASQDTYESVTSSESEGETARTVGSYSSTTASGRAFLNDLQQATDMTGENETVQRAAEPMVRIVSIIVQLIAYVITAGMTLRVALDLCYIALPFSRTFLANGHVGNPQAGTPGSANGMGMGAGMGAGMGMGVGMGGFNSGFGSYNRGMGMGGMSSPGSFDQGSRAGSIQWVSTAALNAVAGEATVNQQTGKPASAFKLYVKDMTAVLILTPVLLVLAVTGTLTSLGFLIGDVLCNTIAKFSF